MTKPTPEEIIGAALSAPSTWPVLTGSERVVKALADAGKVIVDLSDIQNLDAVVKVLGIEDSHITPAEKVEELIAEIERLDAILQQDTGS